MTLPGFITRNFRLKVLCTLIALVTWVGVVYAGNPPDSRLVLVPVPQLPSSIPANYVLVHRIPDLTVRVGGPRNSLTSFNVSSINVSVDWGRITHPGVVTLPVTLTNTDPNVQLIDPPTTVDVDIDTLDSVVVPVSIDVTNDPPPGYYIASESASPDQVVVSGPRHELTGLQARVVADLGNFKTNFVEDAAVLVYDARGDQLTALTVSSPPGATEPAGKVKVTIIVSANITTRAVAVLPRTTGNVAAGYEYSGITVSPPNVVLAGPQNLLNALNAVYTSPVSLTGLTGAESFSVDVSAPNGLSVSPGRVTVTVFVRALPAPPPTAAPSPSASSSSST